MPIVTELFDITVNDFDGKKYTRYSRDPAYEIILSKDISNCIHFIPRCVIQ